MEDTMQTRKTLPLILLVATLIVAACSQAAPTKEVMMEKEPTATTEVMMEDKDAEMMDEKKDDDSMMEDKGMMDATATPEVMMEDKDAEMMDENKDDTMMDEKKDDDSMMDDDAKDDDMTDDAMDDTMMAPAWFDITLTNAATGETFTLNDFKGKVVLVETLAQWCSNCRKQQQQVLALHEQLGDQMDFVSLGLDIDPNEDATSLKAYIESNGFTWLYAVAPAELSHEISAALGDQFLNPPSTPMFIIDRHGEIHPLDFGIKSAEDLLKEVQSYLDGDM
jgi:thiol-disulfide isomerase/thioredoxin